MPSISLDQFYTARDAVEQAGGTLRIGGIFREAEGAGYQDYLVDEGMTLYKEKGSDALSALVKHLVDEQDLALAHHVMRYGVQKFDSSKMETVWHWPDVTVEELWRRNKDGQEATDRLPDQQD